MGNYITVKKTDFEKDDGKFLYKEFEETYYFKKIKDNAKGLFVENKEDMDVGPTIFIRRSDGDLRVRFCIQTKDEDKEDTYDVYEQSLNIMLSNRNTKLLLENIENFCNFVDHYKIFNIDIIEKLYLYKNQIITIVNKYEKQIKEYLDIEILVGTDCSNFKLESVLVHYNYKLNNYKTKDKLINIITKYEKEINEKKQEFIVVIKNYLKEKNIYLPYALDGYRKKSKRKSKGKRSKRRSKGKRSKRRSKGKRSKRRSKGKRSS